MAGNTLSCYRGGCWLGGGRWIPFFRVTALSPEAITWYLNRLHQRGLVKGRRNGHRSAMG